MYRVGKTKLLQVSNYFFGNHCRVYLLVVNRHGCFDHGDCEGWYFVVIFSCLDNLALDYISKVLRKLG